IDTRAELQPGLAAEFPGVPFFHTLEEFLQNGPEVDVLTVATPNGLHAVQAGAGLRHGLHVVVEKPIALTTADAETIVRTARETGRLAFGVMQNRYSPPAAWLKQIYDEGRLGQVFLVQLNCFWNRDARYYQPGGWKGTQALDGGTLFTQFSHFVDLLNWVFGDITNITARFQDFTHGGLTEFEDSGMVTFDLVRGGSGTLSYSTAVWDRNLESSLTVVAERGSLRIAGQYMDKVEYCHLENYSLPELPATNPANNYGPFQGSAANHVQVIENVVDTVQQRSQATTNASEGLKVVEIIERIYSLRPAIIFKPAE
ncbi:MAG: oxidoreductase, partial [Hymenobacter sp.]|nr:oxidoreductase [Hymenobacter sp.]